MSELSRSIKYAVLFLKYIEIDYYKKRSIIYFKQGFYHENRKYLKNALELINTFMKNNSELIT